MSPILALSLTGKIEQYGAYAGIASVLGLAVLSLLYFAQAREVKRLREWAGRAPERAAELQDRVQADAQRRVVAQPQAQPRPAMPVAGPVQPGAQPPRPATPAPAAATAAGQAIPAAATAAAAAATAAGATATSPALPAGPAGQPTTVQPAAAPAPNGGAPVSPPPGQPLRVPPAATPPPRAGGPATPQTADDGPGRAWLPIAGTIAGLLVLAVIVVFVVLGGGNGSGRQTTTRPAKAPAPQAGTGLGGAGNGSSTTPVQPNGFATAVLNGTTVPGLARGVAVRLQNANFKTGTVTNAADQSHSATIVEYAPGRRREAAAVAKAIDVAPDAVQQLSPGTRAIAGAEALVVVTVGNDQNQSPQQQP